MLQIPPTLPEAQSIRRNEPVARPIAAPVVADASATAAASAAGAAAKVAIPVIQPGDSNKTREALQRTPIANGAAEAAEADADTDQALSLWLRQTGGVAPSGLPERMARLLAQLATAAAQGQPGQAAAWPTPRSSIADTPQARPQAEAPARNLARAQPNQALSPAPSGAPVASAASTDRTSSTLPRATAASAPPALGDTPRHALAALRQQLADSPLFDLHRLRDLLMPAMRQAPLQSPQIQAPVASPMPSPPQAGPAGQGAPQAAQQQPSSTGQASSAMPQQQMPPPTLRPTAAAQHMAAVAALLPQNESDGRSAGEARATAGALPPAADARIAQAAPGEQLPASQMRPNATMTPPAQVAGQAAAPAKPQGAAAEAAGKASAVAGGAAGLVEAEPARSGAEAAGTAPRLADGPRLDATTMRQALQVLMQGALQWQGELTPGVRAKILREEAWDRDPDAPGQVAKGAQISVELELPNMGKLRIAGLQIQDSVRLRIMPAAQSRESFAAALDDLRTHLDGAGMPAAQVVLDEGKAP